MIKKLLFSKQDRNVSGLIKVKMFSNIVKCLCLFLFSFKNYSQCNYPTAASVVGSPITFCIDNTNSNAISGVGNNNYVVLNVVQGFSYTFSVSDIWPGNGNNEVINIYNNVSPGFSLANGNNSINYTATFSGAIRILVNRRSCGFGRGSRTGTLTVALTGVNNVGDNQLLAGTDSWIGHIYNSPSGASPTTGSSNAAMFAPSGLVGYVGNYSESESFGFQTFGGQTVCLPVSVNGVNRVNLYTEQFAVRYRMRSTRPAGCYLITIRGDDGTRLYINGSQVTNLNQWTDHGTTSYANIIVNFPSNSTDLVLDYYENTRVNQVAFSIVPYNNPPTNTITPALTQVCSGIQTQIKGSYDFDDNAGTVPNTNPSFTFSWERSTNGGTSWTPISGATGLDYTHSLSTTTNVVTQYRRTATPTVSGCAATVSAPITITTSPSIPAQPGTISGLSSQCPSIPNQVYSVTAVPNAITYNWTFPTGWTIVSGAGTNNVTVTTGTTGQNGDISVTATNACGTGPARSLGVVVASSTVGGSIAGGSTVCSGSASPTLTLSGHTGTVLRWESSVSPFSTWTTVSPANTSTTYTPGILTQTTQFRAVVQNGSCASANSVESIVRVNTAPTVTPNKVDETCPTSNNGTISPTFSGGVSNVQYIKLTQKYLNADAYQQVGEIEAYEIFTGTNVARSTNGATATALSSYLSNVPALAIDGDIATFWNSNTPNINEWIQVDLGSAKNLDNIRIYHRQTSYQPHIDRGQNMLLELLNASEVVVYSKMVDLRGGGTNYVDVNVLDVSWSDPATTLNRTGLDSGDYTLNYADGAGCSLNTLINITSTYSAPTVANAGPSQTLCGAGASGFTMAANTVGSGETGTWSTVSGNPHIISPSDPNSKVTVAPGTTAVLRWTISNSNCTSTSDVTLTNNASSTATPTGNSAQSFCASATVAELVATGTNIKWYSASSGGTPLATSTALINGNVYYASQTVGICESSGRFAVTVTVRAVPSVTIGGTATACQGELRNIRFTNNHTEAITVTYNINGGTNTTVNIAASTFADVLASTVSSGTFVYNLVSAVFQSGTSCPVTLSGSATVEIIETPEAPTIGTITNISCTVSSGSVVLSGLPSTGTWSISSTPVTTPRTGTGTSATISGLAMGDYTFVVTNEGGCPSSATGTVTISDGSSTTWDGNEWSHGTPDATKNIIIDSVTPDSPFTADLVGCALTIKTGVVATVSSEVTLTITNAVTTNGQLIFEDKSSLIQINNVQNTGSISYKRITPPVRRYDFTYWSSPVFEPTLESVSPLTLIDKYHSYTGTGWFYENKINKMKTGKGYAIRAPQTYDITNAVAYPATFVGVPNNGDIDGESVAAGNYYLAGNPYPSAINIGKFLQDNSNVLEGTIEFWSHNQYPVFNVATGKYEYQSTDYLAYNTSGGIGTPGGTYPDAVITSGQSVLVKVRDNAPVGSKIIFNNDMRIGVGGKNNQFFKPGMADKTRMWLNFANDNGVFKQTLLGYFDEATNGYEDNYDAITSDQNAYADFYTINGEDHFTIQGKASFEDKDVVPLGYRAKMEGSYTIKAARIEGLLLSSDIYLEDKTLNKIHNLKEEPYTFTTKAGAFNERFIIKYTNKTLGIDDFEKTQNGVIVSIKEKVIKIESSLQNIKDVVVYDVSGKLLYQKNKVDGTLLAVEKLQSSNQVLLVKVILDNGYETTKKIIF